MNQAMLNRMRHGGSSCVDPKLAQQVGDVATDSSRADVQPGSNFAVAQPQNKERQDFGFPNTEEDTGPRNRGSAGDRRLGQADTRELGQQVADNFDKCEQAPSLPSAHELPIFQRRSCGVDRPSQGRMV